MIDLAKEISFKTSRSGGKGGQNVNKVETSVEGYFHVASSSLLDDSQKELVAQKLSHRINAEGFFAGTLAGAPHPAAEQGGSGKKDQ